MGLPPTSYPRLHVNPEFVRAVRATRIPRTIQAQLVGFPHISTLTKFLYADTVLVTPTVRERLEALARFLEFDGPIFLEPAEDAEARP